MNDMSHARAEEEHNPYAPFTCEEEWWKAEEQRIQDGLAESYCRAFDLKNGGKERILAELRRDMIARGDESVMDYFDIFTGSQRVVLKNPHPLTQQQEDDLRDHIIAEFGPPKIS
jgi:hypothetical protein